MTPFSVRRSVVMGGLSAALAFTATYAVTAMRLPAAAVLPNDRAAQNQEPTVRTWQVTAKRYRFEPARIEVFQDDLVKVELHAEDIAHSFTIDNYRIAKRVGPGQPVTFEFRADQPGTFPFYCNLQIDEGCRQMHGELVVKPRR